MGNLLSFVRSYLATNDSYKWNILLLIVCLWIGWHYWMLQFISSTPFPLIGAPGPPPPRYGADFDTFYSAAKSWLSHDNPYILHGSSAGAYFVYPPTSLPFYAVFTFFPFATGLATQLWVVVSLVFFAVGLLAVAFTLRADRQLAYVSLAILLSLTSYPLLVALGQGQSDLLVSGLVMISLVCERLNHRFWSASVLSIATMMKGPALLLLIYFVLFRRDAQYFLRFVISILLVVGATLLVVPFDLYWYWFWNVLPTFSTAFPLTIDPSFTLFPNESVTGLLVLAHLSQITFAVSITAFVLFGVFSFRDTLRKVTSWQELLRADAMFLMNILVILLFSPRNTQIYPYVGIVLPLALFLSALLLEKVKVGYLTIVGLAAFLLNSRLTPNFLYTPILLPLELVGGLILTVCLIQVSVNPATVIQHRKAARNS